MKPEDLARLPILIDAIGEPSFMVDPEGIVVAWNAAAEEFFGQTRSAAIGQLCPALVMGRRPNGESVCTLDCPYIQGVGFLPGEPAAELIVRTAERGVRRWVTRLHIPLGDSIGAPIGLLHVFIPSDRTQRSSDTGKLVQLRVIAGTQPLEAG